MRKREDVVFVDGREFVLREIYGDAIGWPIGVVHAVLVTERERRWWWRIDRSGRIQHAQHADKIVPQKLHLALKVWMATEGYDMPLVEFLTQTGVLQ